MAEMKGGLYQAAQLRQELKINPRLYQAMDLLYMPLLDLQQHLKQELWTNPFLELVDPSEEDSEEPSPDAEAPEASDATESKEEQIDWEDILLGGFDTGGARQEYEEREYVEPTAVAQVDLHDHLLDQLRLLTITRREALLGEEMIGEIDEYGFLTGSLEEVVASLNEWLQGEEAKRAGFGTEPPFTVGEAEEMLKQIQNFDPPGVGARDLRESILIQLRERGEEDTLAYRIVRDHFPDLIAHRWSEISKAVGIEPKEVQAAADLIAKLDPKPGLKYASTEDNYVVADLVVEEVDGEYRVFHNDASLPRLRISRAYREIARDRSKFQGESREFITSRLNSANWMIQAIEQRRQTMLKVMNFIVDRQREFFQKGVEHLKPLTLREVADAIGMHESTVSRVTNEKYVQTPRGVFPLKFFFSGGLATESGEDVSARGIKAKIRKLVDEEDTGNPLTDQQIAQILKKDGVNIARRTVAKYRDQLGILPARMRKRV